ncbi:P-loop containing nucleoside triphosphate hydrolase protein [Dichomitus squalens LYAD-421 SS1]|uniref:P-loop containing nucleoside triphosphate hydrolase protein n=1 Tax=Dichomitus squalens (strain LYAD-421) TaxID=732165 RepID=UPI0004412998|nr:P-loop containing nucleoside triphosphate hydrolase protein [Dichomitus squalens LYAD-421 SS1]EJF66965.1 P-loop containing nucleoside triphosphate hydrolase protein [Dichomitus squalens LYAD-421 SS1]
MQIAFPSVKQPTPVQRRLIHAVLSGKDVLLKDKTGSGKSFALLIALLSQMSGSAHNERSGSGAKASSINSLLLVPHRDLAYQFFYWIECIHRFMTLKQPLASIAQILVRDSSAPLREHLAPIQQTPPQILIGTPQAVLEAVEADPHALPLDGLSTVVVDEADYLIESVPMLRDKYAMKKMAKKIERHPGPTRLLLNHIYGALSEDWEGRPRTREKQLDRRRSQTTRKAPQLVMMSATLRNHLRRFLLADSGWFTKGHGTLVKITGDPSAYYPKEVEDSAIEDKAESTVGGTDVKHHVLVIDSSGHAHNIEGAVSASPEQASTALFKEPLEQSQTPETPEDIALREALDEGGILDASNYYALEAVAVAFGVDVPKLALLVLPSNAPVQQRVDVLRAFGINAHPLDVIKDGNGRSHLMQQNFDATDETPTLLVSTLASTRGLDLPQLSHVFILGILDGGVDSYLHVAGRVGRFGRGGRVISVLSERHEVVAKDGKVSARDEPRMMAAMLERMGITPVKYEDVD